MGSKTRLGSYCTKRANNGVNLVTSRKINTRLARPMVIQNVSSTNFYEHSTFIFHNICVASRNELNKEKKECN